MGVVGRIHRCGLPDAVEHSDGIVWQCEVCMACYLLIESVHGAKEWVRLDPGVLLEGGDRVPEVRP